MRGSGVSGSIIVLLICAGLGRFSAATPAVEALSEAEANAIGVEAYTFLYPLVTMEISRRQLTNIEAGKMAARGPMNTFSHMRAYPSATMREVVRPNFDTLYSSAWLDLTKEPIIVSVPDTKGRFYQLPILDMWSDVVASPGWRTSGTKVGHFAVVPPAWKGKLPAGVERIDVPTAYAWIIGRTQTNGPSDYEAVHQIQNGYVLTALSSWRKPKTKSATVVKIDPKIDMKTAPLDQVNRMSGAEFFTLAVDVMKWNPPHLTDWSTVARLKRVGIEAGKSFNFSKLPAEIQKGLSRAPSEALALFKQKLPTLARNTNGWQMNTDTMGVYGNYYLKRAIVAMVGLGANQADDAIYPMLLADSDGNAPNGINNYVLHFAKEDLPPVSAFWSVTMYGEDGFQVANSINRFAIGDRDSLKYNSDGSLDLYLQNSSPGSDLESNWLPAPRGPLGVTMRLYAPKQSVLDGRWSPPAVKLNRNGNS